MSESAIVMRDNEIVRLKGERAQLIEANSEMVGRIRELDAAAERQAARIVALEAECRLRGNQLDQLLPVAQEYERQQAVFHAMTSGHDWGDTGQYDLPPTRAETEAKEDMD